MPVATINPTIASEFGPAYRKIEANLRSKIANGTYSAGSMLPSRRDLSKVYGVDVNTVQRAIKMLLDDGTLRADGWRGTFVADSVASPKAVADSIAFRSIESEPITLTDRVTIGVVASITPRYKLSPSDVVWPEDILHAFERSIATGGDIAVEFRNRWHENSERAVNLSKVVGRLIDEAVDAVVVIFPELDAIDDVVTLCGRADIPIVLVTPSYHVRRMAPRVSYNNVQDGYIAASHLLRRGYSNIVFFNTVVADWVDERLEGIKQALELASEGATFSIFDYDIEAPGLSTAQTRTAYAAAPKLLNALPENCGIVGANDNISLGLLQAAADLGLQAGRDFGLVSFDDLPTARELGLTSLRPPLDAMGTHAAEMVLQALRGAPSATQVVLPSTMVPRKSSVAISR